MDKKEKAMDFGIRLLDSLNYLLTLTLIAILFVSGLFYYIHWKYGREPEQNPPETRRTRKDMTSSIGSLMLSIH